MKLSKLKKIQEKRANQSTMDRIHAHLFKQGNAALPYIPKESHKPSEFGQDCLRRVYYSYYKVDPDKKFDAKILKIFDTGRAFESMIMSWLKSIDEYIPYRNKDGSIPKDRRTGEEKIEFPIVCEDYRIRKGYIDNVAILQNKLWIYEIKSIKSDKFAKLTGPQKDHVIQNAIYLKAFEDGLANGDYAHIEELDGFTEVEGVKFFYINKDNSDVLEIAVKKEQIVPFINMVEKKVEASNEYIDEKNLPPKTEGNCWYCPFFAKCKKDWNEVKTYEEKVAESGG